MFSAQAGKRLSRKIMGIGVFLSLTPVTVLAIGSWILMQRAGQNAIVASARPAGNNLNHLLESLLAQCQSMHEEIGRSINGAQVMLENAGPLELDTNHLIKSSALNQFNGQVTQCQLPVMKAGKTLLTPVASFSEQAPIVDEIQRVSGKAATIFERMNTRGDMLPVSTTLSTASGMRAIGAVLPYAEPDGKANPILVKVLAKETNVAKTMTPDGWYVEVFAPLTDATGKVIGMLSTGVPETELTAEVRRFRARFDYAGKEHLFVLEGDETANKLTVIAEDATRGGTTIRQEESANGQDYLETIFKKASAAKPGDVSELRYDQPVNDGRMPRPMIARFTYFPEWNWVIGVTQPEEEYLAAAAPIRALLTGIFWMSLATLVGAFVVAQRIVRKFSHEFAQRIGSSVVSLSAKAQEVSSAANLVAHGPLDGPTSTGQASLSPDSLHDQAENLIRLANGIQETAEKLRNDLEIEKL